MENHLLSRIINGEATSEEREEFFRHLGDNKEDEELFYEVKSLWIRSSFPTGSVNVDSEFENLWNKIKPEAHKPKFRIGKQILRIAAVLLVIFGLGGVVGYFVSIRMNPGADLGVQKYTALKGSVSIVELADGTKIWLNSGSVLTYCEDIKDKKRISELSGEAYFEVKHREDFPLYVKTKHVVVKDLGTTFNIKAYDVDNFVETSLVEGKADVLSLSGTQMVSLKPGESAMYFPTENKIKLRPIEDNVLSAWRDGKFVIRDQRLEDIFKEVSRWYDVSFKFENDALRDLRYTGNIRKSTTAQNVVKMLKLTTNFNYRIIEHTDQTDEIIIY